MPGKFVGLAQGAHDQTCEDMRAALVAPVVDLGIRPVGALDSTLVQAIQAAAVQVQHILDRKSISDLFEGGSDTGVSSHIGSLVGIYARGNTCAEGLKTYILKNSQS